MCEQPLYVYHSKSHKLIIIKFLVRERERERERERGWVKKGTCGPWWVAVGLVR